MTSSVKTIARPLATQPKTAPPKLYQVILLNDDFTPMEFVIIVLQRFFQINEIRATAIMLSVHHTGRGICGVYTQDVASTKVAQVIQFARENHHPLNCIKEPYHDL
jgi:ATP-dependent Clp protease adaptor protein ClpS